jgi:hypothetical protein
LALGLSSAANAGLLDEITTGGAAGIDAMNAQELSSVVGEGTSQRFIEIPHLARSFERTIQAGELTVSIVAVAGSGITITLDGPHVPTLP